jgi:hypothetical protein
MTESLSTENFMQNKTQTGLVFKKNSTPPSASEIDHLAASKKLLQSNQFEFGFS